MSRLHRAASRLLWRHLTIECGLLDMMRSIKDYLLLGRGNVFHALLHELHPLMSSQPPPLIDLQAYFALATHGEPSTKQLLIFELGFRRTVPSSSPYDVWRSLTLDVRVDWPLNLLLHTYSRARCGRLKVKAQTAGMSSFLYDSIC